MKISRIFKNLLFGLSFLFLIFLALNKCTKDNSRGSNCLSINFWYGDHQSFGNPGLSQRWINILGNVKSDHGIQSLYYKLNGADSMFITWGQDRHRLANKGDFNMEVHYLEAQEGTNIVQVTVRDSIGHILTKEMTFDFYQGKTWPLPFEVIWKNVSNIQRVSQIVDGHWLLTEEGIRTSDPWYDRIIAMGDSSWRNYEINTSVIFHSYSAPIKGPPNYGVSHAALAMRWPGHDKDELQPHIKWYPLGATCEFQLKDNLDSCRWRILGDHNLKTEDTYQHFTIKLGVRYYLRSQVENIEKDLTRYRVKIWQENTPEPPGWQLSAVEGAKDLSTGSALLIAHNTDVTFGNVRIIRLK